MPKDYFLSMAKKIKDENESTRGKILAQQIYEMMRKHRGEVKEDLFGQWRDNVWRWSSVLEPFETNNVFQSLIRGAEANFVQSDIKLEIRTTADNAESRAVRRIAKGIEQVQKEKLWGESSVQNSFYKMILGLNAYFISRFDGSKGSQVPIPEYTEAEYEESGKYQCGDCYSQGDYPAEACECGSTNLMVTEDPTQGEMDLVGAFGNTPSGEPEVVVTGGLDVSVDPNGSPCDVSTLDYLEWRYTAHKNKLKRLYPKLKFDDSKPEWSYQTRLKMGFQRFSSGESFPTTETDKETYEVRQIWLNVQKYEDYVPPIDITFGNFKIKAGIPMGKQAPDGSGDGSCKRPDCVYGP